ncbi:MAG: glycosyltransferase, partial [Micrococcales bacterium]
IATMEAMASGRPVVAADAMALPHLVHDGDNGYLFQPDDVDEFADKLKRVLTAEEAELARLSENSLHLIQAHDIERTLKIFEDLYVGTDQTGSESDDNKPEYSQPIGLLAPALHDRVEVLRQRAREIRERSVDLRERITDATEEVRDKIEERLEEVREEVIDRAKAVDQKLRQSVKKVAEKANEVLKGEDD